MTPTQDVKRHWKEHANSKNMILRNDPHSPTCFGYTRKSSGYGLIRRFKPRFFVFDGEKLAWWNTESDWKGSPTAPKGCIEPHYGCHVELQSADDGFEFLVFTTMFAPGATEEP